MSKKEIIRSECRHCNRSTNHSILHSEENSVSEVWNESITRWQTLQCLGCDTYAFRKVFEDFDDIYQGHDGETFHSVTIKLYPPVISNHRPIYGANDLPPLIRKIYVETLKAISDDSLILAGIGLRATIEAVCNNKNISGKTLDKRIEQLFKGGFVSNSDKRRLHAIRFLGNDAAHEIKQASVLDLKVALEIVEHLLNTVYLLESRGSRLEVTVENIDQFCELLRKCCESYRGEDVANLNAILGQKKRSIGVDVKFDDLETELKAKIISGDVDFLKIGSVQSVEGKDVQMYEIVKNEDDDFDIPNW